MSPRGHQPQPRFPTSRRAILCNAELRLRQAGRWLELSDDPQQQRLAKVVFRLASRVRSDREVAA